MTALPGDRDVERWACCDSCGGYEPVLVLPETPLGESMALGCDECGPKSFSRGVVCERPRCACCRELADTSVCGEPLCFWHASDAGQRERFEMERAEVSHAAE